MLTNIRSHIRVLLLAVIICLLATHLTAVPVYACSPAPWTFEQALSSKAMIYGKVIESADDNRQATVEVFSYVGPEPAPRIVHLPSTIDSNEGSAEHLCPDFSMRFVAGSEYVFFLADIPPHLQLLEPKWITASAVDNGQLIVGLPRGETDSVAHRLQQFAEENGYKIQTPARSAPVWGEEGGVNGQVVILIVATVCLILTYVYSRRQRGGSS